MAKTKLRRWPVEFYRDANQRMPVREWLNSVDEAERGRIAASIDLLAEFGPTLDYPHTSQLEGKLRELRVHVGKSHYRVLYFFDPERRCILLHGFLKITPAVEQADIRAGLERLEDHLRQRHGKGERKR
jgi:hypothetical protein